MKITLQATFRLTKGYMVSIKTKEPPAKLKEIKNFIIFHEEESEEVLAEKALTTFPELLSVTFNDANSFNIIYTRDE